MKQRVFFLAWASINLLRLLIIFQMGPMPQDAYYHFYSQHLDWSYYDHPPVIAYLIRLFTEIFGTHTWSVKLADFSVTMLSQIVFYALARAYLTTYHARIATLLFSTTLMVSILSVVSTPDVPLILFWGISLLLLYRAIFDRKVKMWILAGLTMGLAFDSKYTGLLLPIGLLGFLLFSRKYRFLLNTRWPYFALFVMILIMSPVIIWNTVHSFASFEYHTTERSLEMTGISFQPELIAGLLGHQSVILLPPLFICVLVGLFRHTISFFRCRLSDESLFLLWFAVPIIGGFLLLSPFTWIKINWLMPGYVTAIILVAPLFPLRWLRWQWIFVAVIHIFLAVEVIWYPVPIKSDDTWYGWDQLVSRWREIKSSHPQTFTFSSDGYKTTAVLQFLSNEKIYGRNIIGQRALQYDFIGDDLSILAGRDAIYLNSEPHFMNLDKSSVVYPQIVPYFKNIEVLDPIVIFKGDKPVRKYQVFLCRGYLGLL